MNVDIVKISKEHKNKFLSLYNLYLYDLSQYTGEDTQENGQYDPTNTYLYLERDELHPFFIEYEGKTVGFILICSPPFVPEGVDYTIQELFLLKKYRGKNIASICVSKVLERFEGNISISQLEENKPAVHFWKTYYREHNLNYTEVHDSIQLDGLDGWHKVLTQTFENAKAE